MSRVLIICEGATEQEFVKTCLYLEFYEKGIHLYTNNIGGNVSTQRIARSVRNSFDDFDYITTLVDFYGFKNNKCTTHEALEAEITHYTKRLFHNVDPSQKFFPYVQMYEFEGLLFSDVSHFDWLDDGWDENKQQQLQEIRAAFQTPEMINNSPHTAPFKTFKTYIPTPL